MTFQNPIIWGVVAVLAFAIGYFVRQSVASKRASSAEEVAKSKLDKAEHEASDIILEAKKKAADVLDESQKEERERKRELDRVSERVIKKEEALEEDSKDLAKAKEKVQAESEKLVMAKNELEEARNKISGELEKVAGLSREEAKKKILDEIQERHNEELAKSLQKLDRERAEEIEKKTLNIITTSIQRYARSHVSELTTSIFQLPSEDFKGKIIGREGRNIRALERATGVELIVDEAPDGIVISSFDPLRREVARLALEKLVKDGRIQPAKIEEKVEEAKTEMNKRMQEIGEAAAFEVGIYDLPKEIIQLLGRLNFRTSFGQNVLTHSIEMSYISGMLASELGANVEIAKKGALLHDIGKAIDHEVEGTHVELGRKILKKYNVDELVIRAMESHHEEYPFSTPESYIVTAADVLSAARPGARRGTLENYVKRLADLERIAGEFEGVKSSFAIAAGRELRVFVIPEKIDDFGALQMARDIASKIQSELKYPGEIKVNVIRETRAVEYAK
jgi:ribonuclease Y